MMFEVSVGDLPLQHYLPVEINDREYNPAKNFFFSQLLPCIKMNDYEITIVVLLHSYSFLPFTIHSGPKDQKCSCTIMLHIC